MRVKSSVLISIAATVFSAHAHAVDHGDRQVGQVQPFHVNTSCLYFTLVGVTEADPVVPANPWFAILRTQDSAKDALATLLAARVAGIPIRVISSGTLACGYPTVTTILVSP